MDRNLGATQVATSSTDAASYGDLYQWGRGADGHQSRTSANSVVDAKSSSDNPGNSNFIILSSSPYDWRSPSSNNLWQGVNGTNNPCPAGFRVPTAGELSTLFSSFTTQNSAGAYASPLKLPMAGRRNDTGAGSLVNVGSYGYYWSSTGSGARASSGLFDSSSANVNSNDRSYGYSVRCIKD
jgi:uncharacterized protein (TIGR02145 family)